MRTLVCSTSNWTLNQVAEAAIHHIPVKISAQAKKAIQKSRAFVDKKLKETDKAFYGINTGFGSLYKIRIENNQLSQLQENLVKSHACGTGETVPDDIVRIIMLLKIKSLSFGFSGVRLKLVERLVAFYNAGLIPIIYQQGSLGASGDLSPLAHMSLPILGLGKVKYKGQTLPAAAALKKMGLKPMKLHAKEGLALLNGTQFSLAYSVWATYMGKKWWNIANHTAALSLDGFDANLSPFDPKLHAIRPHQGQIETAKAVRNILKTSKIAKLKNKAIQDPYSFRCIPQVHGATYDALLHAEKIFTTEINSVTDNPNLFVKEDQILSGGNFHAQPLALVLDYLAIGLAELGSISERRTYLLISGQRDLPAFLANNPGVMSGLMIPQYTAASIVSQNKQLCTPASADSIPSSNGQEDHVSMAANAGTKLYRIIENIKNIIAIEWLTASQAITFREQKTSKVLLKKLAEYRKIVPIIHQDRIFSDDIQKTALFLSQNL